jgi:hypothetical protein
VAARSRPTVADGHVAAWVGIGGPDAGPNGADQWLQVGLSAAPGSSGELYYEVARPGAPPRYVAVQTAVRPGERHLVAVREMAARPNWWRVWIDGRAVSQPIFLPPSGRARRPLATAETWDAGGRVCNRFDYAFDRVQVAGGRGGAWRRFVDDVRFEDPGYRVLDRPRMSFRATNAG